jgi:hypothetical protein
MNILALIPIVLMWDNPTHDTLGVPIPATGPGALISNRIERSICGAHGEFVVADQTYSVTPAAEQYTVDIVGCNVFRVYARSDKGESLASAVAIYNPRPNAPTNVVTK